MSERPTNDTKVPHPDFDGHLEYSLRDKTPTEKIIWLEAMIELRAQLHQSAKASKNKVSN